MSEVAKQNSFYRDFIIYVSRMREFRPVDWMVYFAWVGLMMGLLFSVSYVTLTSWSRGAVFPVYVWNIPVGALIFVVAIAIDTVGHRTVYREYLAKGEALVHHITIFCGITSVLALCLGATWPEFFKIPALVLVVLSIVYSFIDEGMHWFRYFTQNSDRVEMWSHLGILIGHGIFIVSWWYWFDQGYPGLDQILAALGVM